MRLLSTESMHLSTNLLPCYIYDMSASSCYEPYKITTSAISLARPNRIPSYLHICSTQVHIYSTYAPSRSLHAYRDRPRGNGGADSTEVYHCPFFTVTVHLSDTTTWLEHNDNTTGMAHGTTI